MMIERVYNINLRKKVKKSPMQKRSNKMIRLIREYIEKHMKSKNVKLNKEINEKVWAKSWKKPETKLKLKAVKDDEGKVDVSLVKE